MKRWLLRTLTTLTCLLLIACPAANAANDVRGAGADPVLSDGDKYHLVFESDCVRVLDYRDAPGARTHLHHHPEFLLYALAPFRRRLTFPDGSTRERVFQAGEFARMPAQSHVGENIGSTETRALLVELKPCRSASP